ncbi:HAMP domain-containing histidine kinase [bacterium]|nr:HAMP domain-containing histidine kinase [bacterium]MBU1883988.1 HAMP domain-containing histidine kinase [bacterium]
MNRVELESFVKSFLLFFVSITLLVGAIFFLQYKDNVKSMDDEIFNQMKLCSFNLKCDDLKLEFIPKNEKLQLYTLYKNDETLSSYFSITDSDNYLLKFTLERTHYLQQLEKLRNGFLVKSLLVILIVVLLSVLFSFYALHPLRKALVLTEEFIKDILHDFNTPLSALRLNTSMLKKEMQENSKIVRIEQSVQTILNLQSNLRAYLTNSTLQKERFSLKDIIDERVLYLERLYPKISFQADIAEKELTCNKDAFVRILDNLLSNAAKYNKKNGSVLLTCKDDTLQIKDTGIGIKNPDKVFQRFYKEQDRGMGIGLHIVKKLCDELGIKITLISELSVGTTLFLKLDKC